MPRTDENPGKNRRSHRKPDSTAATEPATGAPALFAELVERARLLTEQGLHQVDELRERVEAAPLARQVRQGLEEGSELLQHERERMRRGLEDLRRKAVGLRETALHRIGLATAADIEKMARQLRALRSQLRRSENAPVEPTHT
jgi:hypothetical protein